MRTLLASMGVALILATTCSVARADDLEVAAGKAVFTKNCTICHGPKADGKGPVGPTLSPPAANLTDPALMTQRTDDVLMDHIRNGVPNSAMPAWKSKLSDKDIHAVVSYLRSLSGDNEASNRPCPK